MECISDSRSGIESVSEAGGVTRRGLFRRAERGMVLIVLKVFCRSSKDAARVQNAEWVSCVGTGRGGGWGGVGLLSLGVCRCRMWSYRWGESGSPWWVLGWGGCVSLMAVPVLVFACSGR